MHITKNEVKIHAGDFVWYRECDTCSSYGYKRPGRVLLGKVSEIFDSMDRTFKCLWIEGKDKLIREDHVVGKAKEPGSQIESERELNNMCVSCTKLGNECVGTIEPAWTGCVQRLPDHLMTITVVRPQSANYTPADLMYLWAKEHGGQFYHAQLGGARLIHRGRTWEYDHWKIEKAEDGTEQITLHLIAERKHYGSNTNNQ